MGWLDNVIGYIAPSWGYKREAWKQGLSELRSNYDAASYGNGSANWRVLNQSGEMTDKYSRDTVRARARDLERNSDLMNSVTRAYKRSVIGGGYRLQAHTKDEALNKEIEKAWERWCKKQNCDVTGTQSFIQLMRMCLQRKKVDGGIIIVKRYTNQGFIPFQLQVFEVDELDLNQMQPRKKGNKVVGGIEYNSYNRPIGYFFKQYSIEGYCELESIYVDAKDVIFYYTKHRPSQIREISDMTPTITRIRDANEFMVAVSVKERIAACLSVFIKTQMPVSGTGMGRPSGQNGEKKREYEGKTIAPGMIKELNAGDEIQVVNPQGQAEDASTYIKTQQRLIGAGQGLSYEATSRDMSETNYSSARQGSIEDDATYEEEREQLIQVMNEVYETFVISCVLKGVFNIKDFWDHKEEYFAHQWIKAPKKWIDPAKEANATKTALYTGQKTFKQIAAENGRDWKEQIDEMFEVLEYGKEKGMNLGGIIYDKENKELYVDAAANEGNEPTEGGTGETPADGEETGDNGK